MNKKDLKKDMTVHELAVLMMESFDNFRSEVRTGFAEVGQRFAQVDVRLLQAENERADIRKEIRRLKIQSSARLELLEDRTVALKKVVEKELDTKVTW